MCIVALNSGGFDSTVLLFDLRNSFPEEKIYSLFFSYGQVSEKLERNAAKRNAERCGCIFFEIPLPKMSWSSHSFLKAHSYQSNEDQYLEFRNLIFLSYALSFSQGKHADKIYWACLKSLGYVDTSSKFIEHINSISGLVGVEVIAPYSVYEKADLANLAKKYEIRDYNSCDTPVNGKPCGVCPDCVLLKSIDEYVVDVHPIDRFLRNYDTKDEKFLSLLKKSPIEEVRFLLNNDCQLSCPHCFYGFKEMTGEKMTIEEGERALSNLISHLPIKNIHFSGKEPLFNEDIFEYATYLRKNHPGVTYDVVTNGVNVPKYSKKLLDSGFKKVFLSIDNISNFSSNRGHNNITKKSLDSLKELGIPCEAFIDLSQESFANVSSIISYLNDTYGVSTFFVRTINHVGSASDIKPLEVKCLDAVYTQLLSICEKLPDILVYFKLFQPDVLSIFDDGENTDILKGIDSLLYWHNPYVLPNLILIPEFYCGRYEDSVTLTPDGYILGCALEVSSPRYAENSAGNIIRDSVEEILSRGKELLCSVNKNRDVQNYCGKCTYL